MNKPILTEAEPKQSIKVLRINISQLQNELLNEGMKPELRKTKEESVQKLSFSLQELEKKQEKIDQSRSSTRLPSLNSETKGYTAKELAELYKLIDDESFNKIEVKDKRDLLYTGLY